MRRFMARWGHWEWAVATVAALLLAVSFWDWYGITFAVGSAGAILGALLANRIQQAFGVGPTIVGTAVFGSLGGILYPLAPHSFPLPFLMIGQAIFMFGATSYNITQVSLRQALLSHSDALVRAFTENLMAYALGRRVEYYDQPTVRSIVKKAGQNDYKFSSFVMGIVTSPAFQMSKSEAVTSTVENR